MVQSKCGNLSDRSGQHLSKVTEYNLSILETSIGSILLLNGLCIELVECPGSV